MRIFNRILATALNLCVGVSDRLHHKLKDTICSTPKQHALPPNGYGAGHKKLRVGDKLKIGDEFYNFTWGTWSDLFRKEDGEYHRVACGPYAYRRKI